MGDQIHRRLPNDFVQEVLELEAFNERRMTEQLACDLLGVKRARFYRMRRDWLKCVMKGKEFRLWSHPRSDFHRFSEEIEEWLHEELRYIREDADLYRGRFNFLAGAIIFTMNTSCRG